MKCFVHHDRDAVGICPSCFRGVCPDCAVDLGRGLACRDRCEIEVRRLYDLRDFSFAQPSVQKKVLDRTGQQTRMAGIFNIVLGAIFILFDVIGGAVGFLTVLGACFFVFGCFSLARSFRLPATSQFRLCNHCGYNITGNTSGKCPECGHLI